MDGGDLYVYAYGMIAWSRMNVSILNGAHVSIFTPSGSLLLLLLPSASATHIINKETGALTLNQQVGKGHQRVAEYHSGRVAVCSLVLDSTSNK